MIVFQEPTEADFASKEDLERGGGGGKGTSTEASTGAAEAAERAREAVAKASKVGTNSQKGIAALFRSCGSPRCFTDK